MDPAAIDATSASDSARSYAPTPAVRDAFVVAMSHRVDAYGFAT